MCWLAPQERALSGRGSAKQPAHSLEAALLAAGLLVAVRRRALLLLLLLLPLQALPRGERGQVHGCIKALVAFQLQQQGVVAMDGRSAHCSMGAHQRPGNAVACSTVPAHLPSTPPTCLHFATPRHAAAKGEHDGISVGKAKTAVGSGAAWAGWRLDTAGHSGVAQRQPRQHRLYCACSHAANVALKQGLALWARVHSQVVLDPVVAHSHHGCLLGQIDVGAPPVGQLGQTEAAAPLLLPSRPLQLPAAQASRVGEAGALAGRHQGPGLAALQAQPAALLLAIALHAAVAGGGGVSGVAHFQAGGCGIDFGA